MSRFKKGDHMVYVGGKKWIPKRDGTVSYVFKYTDAFTIDFGNCAHILSPDELSHNKTWAIKQFFNEVQ